MGNNQDGGIGMKFSKKASQLTEEEKEKLRKHPLYNKARGFVDSVLKSGKTKLPNGSVESKPSSNEDNSLSQDVISKRVSVSE